MADQSQEKKAQEQKPQSQSVSGANPPASAPADPAPEPQYVCVYKHWTNIPEGTIKTESGWGGPDNVARLLAAGCIQPAVA